MPTLAVTLKKQLKAARQQAIDVFQSNHKPEQLLTQLRRNVDEALSQAWTELGMPAEAALVAVGGYGRGELFPYSDVDVLILLPKAAEGQEKEKLESLVQLLWDIGLEIGHSIRTVDECMDESAADITVQTSLLEARLVTGSRKLFKQLQERYQAALDPLAFFHAKTLEMRQRHIKYEDTPYSLEPNCKESPGGLRDLQVILWVSKAAGLGDSWGKLAEHGMLTATEARQLRQKERAFKDIRIRLHLQTNRREDRLVFDIQTPIAESFGFKTSDTRRASEYLMQRYYWAAKAVTQLNTILLQNIEAHLFPQQEVPKRINDRFNEVNGFVDIAHGNLFEETPSAMLEVFLVLAEHPELKDMSARTMRALWHARFKIDNAFRANPENHRLFMQILQSKRGITHALRRMNATSVLGRYLPNFRHIVGQMQHDLFHVYTVDQHILMVLRNIRRFFIPEHTHEYPFCSQLAAQFDRPALLYIAALFHDIAKGRGGDHSDLGAVEARRFCRAHGLPKADAALVEFLVEHHLTLSRVAQKEDLSDPEVILQFARKVKDERHLTALYLLTVADIRGTGPKVWNAWKGKLLEDLYRLTLRALGGAKLNMAAEIEGRKQEARQALALKAQLPGTEDALWKTLDLSYFARHDAQDLAWHARALWRHVESTEPVVRSRPSPVGEGLQVLVYAKDQQDLFARICGYFDGAGFNILDAKVHTTRTGYALDTFQVIAPELDLHHRDLTALVESKLSQALVAQGPLPEPRKGRLSRRVKSFPFTPRIALRPDERAQRWLLSVSATDRAGLLYAIARVLARHGINLQLAKVSTLGERVEDTFLLDGAALQQSRMQLQIEGELLDALAVQ